MLLIYIRLNNVLSFDYNLLALISFYCTKSMTIMLENTFFISDPLMKLQS